MKSIFALAILFSTPALAQKLTVTKVKGNQAIVNVSGGKLEVGQSIDLSGDEEPDFSEGGSGGGSRAHVIGLSGSLRSAENDVNGNKITRTLVDFTGSFGWNKQTTEFGLIALLGMTDGNGVNTTKFGGGGFFDFNFTPNRPGNDMIFGLGIQATYASTSGSGVSSSTMAAVPSGFLKWYALGNSTAIRFDLGYSYAQTEGNGNKVTDSGFGLAVGFGVYF